MKPLTKDFFVRRSKTNSKEASNKVNTEVIKNEHNDKVTNKEKEVFMPEEKNQGGERLEELGKRIDDVKKYIEDVRKEIDDVKSLKDSFADVEENIRELRETLQSIKPKEEEIIQKQEKPEERSDVMPEKDLSSLIREEFLKLREEERKSEEEKKRQREQEELAKAVKDLKNIYCTPDGKWCFATEQQLKEFMEKQSKELQEIKELVTKKEEEKPKEEKPEEEKLEEEEEKKEVEVKPQAKPLKRWADMTEEERENMIKELNSKYPHPGLYEWLRSCPECFEAATKRPELKEAVMKNLSNDELASLFSSCTGPECKMLHEELLKRGIQIRIKDKKGRWTPLYGPEEPNI